MNRQLPIHQVGDPAATPVLYLHGSGSSRLEAELYADVAADLGVRLIAWDRPGSGLSPAYPDRRIVDVVDDAHQVLQEVGVARAPAVGLSGGATHVLCLAACAPDVVSAAVAVNPGPPATPDLTRQLPLGARLAVACARRPRLLAQVARATKGMGEDLARALRNPIARRRMNLVDLQLLSDPVVLARFAAATKEGSRQPDAWLTEALMFWGSEWGFDPYEPPVPLDVFSAEQDPYRAFACALADRGATLHTFPGGHLGGLATEVMTDVLLTCLDRSGPGLAR